MINPWQRQGVSIIPPKLEDLMPIVGQKRLFSELEDYRNECLGVKEGDPCGFFLLHGGWGVGKSRVGHELCLEALSEQVEWIVEGQPVRVLRPGVADGILPLFVRYIQVTGGPLGEKLSYDNWIPSVTVEALSRLVGIRKASGSTGRLLRNQDKLMELTRCALKPKGWDQVVEPLKAALSQPDVARAATEAVDILKQQGLAQRLWIIIDEIEDITDVNLDGLGSNERTPIDQALLTVIPRVIKYEELRQEYPEVNFVLLCSLAVGDLLRQIQPNMRRTKRHELRTNAFTDVEAFFAYLKSAKPAVANVVDAYPEGLKEAAFFAANRNFGWFNVVMHHAHQNVESGGSKSTGQILRLYGETSQGRENVFNTDALTDFRIEADADKAFIEEAMYSLVPRRIHTAEDRVRAERLFAKRDAGGARRPIFTPLVEVAPPQLHRVTTHFIKSGFQNESGTLMVLPGEGRFDMKVVIDSLAAYSNISLPNERRDHLLICRDLDEFRAQIKSLSPYAEQVDHFAGILHGLLMDPELVVPDGEYLAPAFTFLAHFNRLNRLQRGDTGYLTESAKNTKLEEAFRDVSSDRRTRECKLLQGIANAIEQDRAPLSVESIKGCTLPAVAFKSQVEGFNVGRDGSLVLLHGTNASDTAIEEDLMHLAGKRPAEPVLIILENQDGREEGLRARLEKNVPKMAPRVIFHNLTRHLAENLVRFGLLGEAFTRDAMMTSHFVGAIGQARNVLRDNQDNWLAEVVNSRGMLLAPLFYGSRVDEDQLAAFAKGYAGMLGGMSYQDACQYSGGLYDSEGEPELFKKLVERQIDPGVRYQDDQGNQPLLALIEKPGAEEVAVVPRALVAILKLCANAGIRTKSLEQDFFFDLPTRRDVRVTPADIVRHLVGVLHHMGLVEVDGDQVRAVSAHGLEVQIKAASDWLQNRYEQTAQRIRDIHHDEGERLVDARGKEARQWLKEAEGRIQALELDFLGRPWNELAKATGDAMPLYEQRIRSTLGVVRKALSVVERVYVPEKERAFSYSLDALREFEQRQSSPNYPLWKRLKVLDGFYQELDRRRRELMRQIDETVAAVTKQVPELKDTGELAFPIQVLTQPLKAYKLELDFSASRPNKTVSVAGSTLGIITVGYKIYDGKYTEAQERLDTLSEELNQPGKLVAHFHELLGAWKAMCEELVRLKEEYGRCEKFMADAPTVVRQRMGLESLATDLSELDFQLNRGGIRQGVDEAETAGAPASDWMDRLEQDVETLGKQPSARAEQLRTLMTNVLPSLQTVYNAKHGDLASACARIRRVTGGDDIVWPEKLAATYGATQASFDALVSVMRKEGEAYFTDVAGTTFDDYIGLCRVQRTEGKIDWTDAAYGAHVEALRKRKLVELRLV